MLILSDLVRHWSFLVLHALAVDSSTRTLPFRCVSDPSICVIGWRRRCLEQQTIGCFCRRWKHFCGFGCSHWFTLMDEWEHWNQTSHEDSLRHGLTMLETYLEISWLISWLSDMINSTATNLERQDWDPKLPLPWNLGNARCQGKPQDAWRQGKPRVEQEQKENKKRIKI